MPTTLSINPNACSLKLRLWMPLGSVHGPSRPASPRPAPPPGMAYDTKEDMFSHTTAQADSTTGLVQPICPDMLQVINTPRFTEAGS